MGGGNKDKLAGIGCGLLAALIWGAWPVVSKLAASQALSAADITALRFGVAGCLLLPVLTMRPAGLKRLAPRGLVLALGAGAPYVLLAVAGLQFAPAAHFGVIAPSSMLVFASLGSHLFLRESLNAARVLGVLLVLAGIVLVGSRGAGTIGDGTLLGDLMFVGCGALWASYTLFSKHWNMTPFTATALVSVISLLLYLPVYLAGFADRLTGVAPEVIALHGFFQGVLSAILALFFYSKAVALLGPAKGAVFSALVPPVALLLGVVVLGETLSAVEVAGLVLVFTGMVCALELPLVSCTSRLLNNRQ